MNVILFILLGLFWGGSFVAVKIVIHQIDPFFGAFLRVILAAIAVRILYKVLRKPIHIPKHALRKSQVAGLFSIGIPFALLFYGEKEVSPGLAGILNGSVPIWTWIISHFVYHGDEKITWNKVAGVIFGLFGIAVIFYPRFAFGGTYHEIICALAITGMAICYGMGSVLNRKLMVKNPQVTYYANTYHQLVIGALFLWFVWLGLGQSVSEQQVLDPKVVWSTLYLSLFSSAFAFMMFFRLIRDWGSVRATTVTYLIPVFALIFDFLFFGAVPNPYEFIGGFFILSGLFLIHIR